MLLITAAATFVFEHDFKVEKIGGTVADFVGGCQDLADVLSTVNHYKNQSNQQKQKNDPHMSF